LPRSRPCSVRSLLPDWSFAETTLSVTDRSQRRCGDVFYIDTGPQSKQAPHANSATKHYLAWWRCARSGNRNPPSYQNSTWVLWLSVQNCTLQTGWWARERFFIGDQCGRGGLVVYRMSRVLNFTKGALTRGSDEPDDDASDNRRLVRSRKCRIDKDGVF
jgi:hypothetical protein